MVLNATLKQYFSYIMAVVDIEIIQQLKELLIPLSRGDKYYKK
jgi:hypothetical protein